MSSSPHREHRQRKSRYRSSLTSGRRPHDRGWNGSRLARLMAKYGGTCALCGVQCNMVVGDDRQATADHVVPVSRGGLDVPSNWQLACAKCNRDKGDAMPGKSG